MPRLFHRNEWFTELSPTALAESEFENLLVQNADLIRPACVIVPFKKTVYAGDRSARADLAIIDRQYREWSIIEVEMIRHDLHRHVIPQIQTLREGAYDRGHAEYLAAKNPELDAGQLAAMLRGEPPRVIVIVNKYDKEWNSEIRRYGAHMMIFEIFRSETSNRNIFSIDGEIPQVAGDYLTELTFSILPRCLLVKSPAALDFPQGQKVMVEIDGQATFWERIDTATQCFISPVGSMPIRNGPRYALVKVDNGQLAIRAIN